MNDKTVQANRTASRIRLREPEEMSPGELEKYNSDPMARTNLVRLLAVAEGMTSQYQIFGQAMATNITVPPLERELVTLATLHLDRGEYEIAQHIEVARMMGIPEDKVAAIAEERYGDPIFSDRERALLAFTRQVVKTVRIDDAIFDAVAAFYDSRQIVEMVFVIGNYMMLLRLSEMAELELDGTAAANFWKDKLSG